MPSPPDRPVHVLEQNSPELPLPPLNISCASGFEKQTLDIRWTLPSDLNANTRFDIIGVNIYRSFDSEFGPFYRLNTIPIGSTFFRDRTRTILALQEDVSRSFVTRGDTDPNGKWVFCVQNRPIVIYPTHGVPEITNLNVYVTVNGDPAFVEHINSPTGEVELRNYPSFDAASQKLLPPVLPSSLSDVVLATYRYIANEVVTSLASRVFYRITTVANDRSTGLLIETPLDRAAQTNNNEIEKLDWIWREAVRRNHFLLVQGGERTKVFIRKVVGPKCGCYSESNKQPSNDCHICFVPSTLVRSEKGYVPIESISIGDNVLSSDGTYQKVTKVFKNQFDGNLVSIQSSVSTNPILSTPNHPYSVLRGTHSPKGGCSPKTCKKFIKHGNVKNISNRYDVRLLPSGKWWARAQIDCHRGNGRVSLGTYETKEQAIYAIHKHRSNPVRKGHIIKWDDASNIKIGDWLVSKWPNKIVDVCDIEVPKKFRKNCNGGPERLGKYSFSVDDDFLWMIGIYLAEGSPGIREINFTLHKNEIFYQEKLIQIFTKLGYNPVIRYKDGVQIAIVSIASTTLANWFRDWLGTHCYNKQIPEEFMSLPSNKLVSLLQGIYDGDGVTREFEIIQTSELLALQISEILHKIGKSPLVSRYQTNVLTPKGNKRRIAYRINWEYYDFKNANRKGRWHFENEILTTVSKIKSIKYHGPVYNLEVEGNHTYVVNGVVVHNCFGTGVLGGYDGPYDIILAPDDGQKSISQSNRGRAFTHPYDTWTGPSPQLSQRDFIVKLNGDRYGIGPVRSPTSRGMQLQQFFSISHLDEGDVRYKVPVLDAARLSAPQTRYIVPGKGGSTPMMTEREVLPDEREIRGNTVVFENEHRR